MQGIEHIKRIYMLGIGGIGMSALARYFKEKGIEVSGYDLTPTPLTEKLEQENIAIHYTEDIEQIDKDADIVIYTPAIPATHKELIYLKEKQYPLLKRSEVLGLISKDTKNICVAGTHGKTTTSTMIAYLMREVGIGGTAFLGGIASNYDLNFWTITQDILTIEADEFDKSFLRLYPDIAVITSVDADHLDIYGDDENVKKTYTEFATHIKKTGTLFYKKGLPIENHLAPHIEHRYSYSANDTSAFIHAFNIEPQDGAYHFEVSIGGKSIGNFSLRMGGRHNLENAVAAIGVLHLSLGADSKKIAQALEQFQGIKRRFNVFNISKNCSLIDDYAHHPSELNALIDGAKDIFPTHKIALVFQPHLYSRTRDFAKDFSSSLSQVDEVLLLDIYPARELPIEGVTSAMLLQDIAIPQKRLIQKSDLSAWINSLSTDQAIVIAMAGAGNIDALVEPTKENLKKHFSL